MRDYDDYEEYEEQDEPEEGFGGCSTCKMKGFDMYCHICLGTEPEQEGDAENENIS